MRRGLMIVPVAAVVVAAVAIAYIAGFLSQKPTLRILCAGSLYMPLSRLASVYESTYGVDVHIEASGSVEAIRKVTDLGKPADIVAVADYTLIREYMVPDYTSWYIVFATNEVVLAFTSTSKYADELRRDPSRWYEVLSRSGVRWGFSDPNKDPCGYRAVGVIALASIYYNDTGILSLITSSTNIEVSVYDNGTARATVPASLKVYGGGSVVVRPKSVDLIGLLEAGALDYAFEYKSVAIQHNLSYIELPREINLGDPGLESYYKRVSVRILAGTSRERTIVLKPIAYGITIPNTAENRDLAIEFVKLLLSPMGRRVFEGLGQPFLEHPIYYGSVPQELAGGG